MIFCNKKTDNVIRFDWAAKNILRDKASFVILEGFLSALLNEKVTITEHIDSGFNYAEVKKVYSVNIVYFNLGEGSDYLYHGQSILRGSLLHSASGCVISNGVISTQTQKSQA